MCGGNLVLGQLFCDLKRKPGLDINCVFCFCLDILPRLTQAKPGQKISITLLDFATIPENDDVCHAYAILRENEPQRSSTICSRKRRELQVYTSATNVLEVRIIGGSTAQTKGSRYFVLKYKGTLCCRYLQLQKANPVRVSQTMACHPPNTEFYLTFGWISCQHNK